MLAPSDLRKIKFKCADGKFRKVVNIGRLENGDIIRFYDPDGKGYVLYKVMRRPQLAVQPYQEEVDGH